MECKYIFHILLALCDGALRSCTGSWKPEDAAHVLPLSFFGFTGNTIKATSQAFYYSLRPCLYIHSLSYLKSQLTALKKGLKFENHWNSDQQQLIKLDEWFLYLASTRQLTDKTTVHCSLNWVRNQPHLSFSWTVFGVTAQFISRGDQVSVAQPVGAWEPEDCWFKTSLHHNKEVWVHLLSTAKVSKATPALLPGPFKGPSSLSPLP